MSGESFGESDIEGIEPFSAEELKGFERVASEGLANIIASINAATLNQELTDSLEFAKIRGLIIRVPDFRLF